ncbi:SS18-like protein 2 isoform X2 [Apodemus sylvaticus]|nr:SS18-like protein 2 isoform X2 [Apodemus sylvaticus]
MSPRCLARSGQDCSPEASRPRETGVTLPGRGFLQDTQLGRRLEIEDPKSTAFCQPGGGAKVRSPSNTPLRMSVIFAPDWLRGKAKVNQETIQRLLEENDQLIRCIVEYQNKGRANECVQ